MNHEPSKNKIQKTGNTWSMIHDSCSMSAGLTFLELIFVLFIVAIISSVVLFNYSSFSSNVSIHNLAEDIALTIKQAQTNALSGAGAIGFSTGSANPETTVAPRYGVFFSSDSDVNGDWTKYYYFYDLNQDGMMNFSGAIPDCSNPPSLGNECFSVTTIQGGDRLSELTAGTTTSSGAPSFGLSIVFKRPFPEPTIFVNSTPVATSAQIEIESKDGAHKHIVVSQVGQISIEDGENVPPSSIGL